jgi:hypothetical protein
MSFTQRSAETLTRFGISSEDGFDAADKVIGDILARIDALVPFPHQGHRRPGSDLAPSALYRRSRIPDCLCAG